MRRAEGRDAFSHATNITAGESVPEKKDENADGQDMLLDAVSILK